MFRNYIKIAFRNLSRNKLYSIISIAGFTVGLTIVLHIAFFINNELSFDSFHKNSKNIYRALINSGNISYGSLSPYLSGKLDELYPQIEMSCRYFDKETELKISNRIVKEKVSFADTSFFKMFSFKIIDGNACTFGSNPEEIIISESIAKKYFGNSNCRGKTISIKLENKFYDFIIAGIAENVPVNSSIKYDILLPYKQVEKTYWAVHTEGEVDMRETYPAFFLQLNGKNNKAIIEKNFTRYIYNQVKTKYVNPDYSLELNPLEDIHFREDVKFTSLEYTSITPVYILSAIACIILVIVSFNYINLTITQSSHRFKEVGIRKVTGAGRKEIIIRFLSESFLVIIVSLLFSTALLELTEPAFSELVGVPLGIGTSVGTYIALLLALAVIISIAAGSYPAIVMSRPHPSSILKGNEKLSGSKTLSKVFIAIQFVLAIIFISSAIIINTQYNYWINHDPGFKKEGVLVVKASEMFGRHINPRSLKLFKDKISENPSVITAGGTEINLGIHENISQHRFDYKDRMIFSYYMLVDEDVFAALGIKFTRGRNFSPEISGDTLNAVIVNEAFVRALQVKNPLNEPIQYLGYNDRSLNIIGVIKDFNYFSLKEEITPAAFRLSKNGLGVYNIYIKFSTKNISGMIKYIEETWNRFIPDNSFDYRFLDETIASLYRTEQRWKDIINYSSVVAIFFAVLGLFALVLYSAERRTKEIGIRKILGASTTSIIKLLTSEYLLIISISLIIGCTATYYLAEFWLRDFAYRIPLGVSIFIYTAGIILFISAVTLLMISLRAAKNKPADSLRYE